MANDNKRKLYDALSEDYDMGTYEQFCSDLNDENKRRKLYDATSQDYDLGSWDSFSNQLGYGKVVEGASSPSAKQEAPSDPALLKCFMLRRGGKDFKVSRDEINAAGGLSGWAAANPGAPLRVYMHGDGFSGHVSVDEAHKRSKEKGYKYTLYDGTPWKPTEGQQAAINAYQADVKARVDGKIASAQEDFKNKSEYFVDKPSLEAAALKPKESEPVVNMETGKLEKTYLTPEGERTKYKTLATLASDRYRDAADMSVGAQIRRAQAELNELTEKLNHRALEVTKDFEKEDRSGLLGELKRANWNGMYGASGQYLSQETMRNSDRELSALRVAIRQKEEMLKDLYEERDRQAGKDVGFWRGFGRVVGDIRTWDLGMSDMQDAATMLSAKKYQREEASEGEKAAGEAMMKAIADRQEVEGMYGGNASFWNRAGIVGGYLPSFMVDFALTGGGFDMINFASKGAAKGAAKVFGEKAIKEMAELGVKKYAKEYGARGVGRMAGNWAIKALGTTADELLVRAPLMTNTVQFGKTMADITERKLGDVVVDEYGNYDFSNDKTWGSAIWQGQANAIIDNYSEIFGKHLDALGKVFGAKRLSGVLARATGPGFSKVMATTRKQFEKLGMSDYFGEIGEEYYGQLWRTGLNLDDAKDAEGKNLFLSEQFHGDIWGGMALSMGLMGGAKYSLSGMAYAKMKHNVNRADRVATEVFTREKWEPLRSMIDGTTNDDIGWMAESIMRDRKLSDKEREAAMTYLESSVNLRGFNLGEMAKGRGGSVNESELRMNESFTNGYSAATPQEMADGQNMFTYQRQRMESMFDKDTLFKIDNAPLEAVDELTKAGVYSEDELDAARAYVDAMLVRKGMMQRVRDDIAEQTAQVEAAIEVRVNKGSGKIHPAVMGLDNRKVYIVDGTVALTADGNIDKSASSETIFVLDAQTGEKETATPNDFVSVGQVLDPEQAKQEAAARIRQEVAQAAVDNMNGTLQMNVGDVVSVMGNDGVTEVTIVGPALDEKTGLPLNDSLLVQMADGSQAVLSMEELQEMADAANMERVKAFEDARLKERKSHGPQFKLNDEFAIDDEDGNVVRGTITDEVDEDGLIEIETDIPVNGRKVQRISPDQLMEMVSEYNGVAQGTITVNGSVDEGGSSLSGSENDISLQHGNGSEQNNDAQWSSDGGSVAGDAASGVASDRDRSDIRVYEAGVDSSRREHSPVREILDGKSALERVPKDEKGSPLFEAVEPRLAVEALIEAAGGEAKAARAAEVASKMAERSKAAVEKVRKRMPKRAEAKVEADDPMGMLDELAAADDKYAADLKKWQEELAAAEAKARKWEQIRQAFNTRRAGPTPALPKGEEVASAGAVTARQTALPEANGASADTARQAGPSPALPEGEGDGSALQSGHDGQDGQDEGKRRAELAARDEAAARQRAEWEASPEGKAIVDARNAAGRVADEVVESATDPVVAAAVAREDASRGAKQYSQAYDRWGAPVSVDEWVARALSTNDGKTMRVKRKGADGLEMALFGRETSGERDGRSWMTSDSNGMSFDEWSHRLWESLMGDGDNVGFNVAEVSDHDLRNVVLEQLRMRASSRSLFELARELHGGVATGETLERAEAEHNREAIEDDWYMQNFGMGREEFEAREEEIYRQIREELNDDVAFESILEQQIEEYEQRRIENEGSGGAEVLSGEGVDNAGRGQGADEAGRGQDGGARAGDGRSASEETGVPGRNAGGNSERVGDLEQKAIYQLSDEVDENGRQFVLTAEGDLEFGRITQETGLTEAPILLSEGIITNPSTNDGYGLVHIEARHGDQIRGLGYDSVLSFVEEVAKNYEVIKKGLVRDGHQTYMLQLRDKHNNTLMVELSGDGTYWNINTAGVFKTSYGRNREEVYNRHTTVKQSAEAVEESQKSEQGGTTDNSSMNSPISSSEGKGTTLSADKQILEGESSEVAGVSADTARQSPSLQSGHDEVGSASAGTARQRKVVYEAAKGLVESAGVEVVEVSDAEAAEMLGRRGGATLSARKKRALDTLVGGSAQQSKETGSGSENHQGSVISFDKITPVEGQSNRVNEKPASGSVNAAHSGDSSSSATDSRNASANVRNNTQSAKNKINKFNNGDFKGDYSTVAKALNTLGNLLSMRSRGGSRYTLLNTDSGKTVAVRLSDHAANGNNFKRDGADRNLSIVIEQRKFETPDSDIEYTEVKIPAQTFMDQTAEVISAIVKGVEDVLADGEFTLDSSLGTIEKKVATGDVRFDIRTYHGTGADFDGFDFSHIGEGEGFQAFGWGGYVTEVEGIGRRYAMIAAPYPLLDGKRFDHSQRSREFPSMSLESILRGAGGDVDAAIAEYERLQQKWDSKPRGDEWRKPVFKEAIAWLKANRDRLSMQTRHLYTVDIPSDNGRNYIDWDVKDDKELMSKVGERLGALKLAEWISETARLRERYRSRDDVNTFKYPYKALAEMLGGEKEASEFLADLGYTGIQYPANYHNGGNAAGKRNYVIFRESVMKITDHVRFLKDGHGRVYGWTVGGKVYLNRDAMNPSTPLHEYTHLWDAMVQRENPELWRRGVELMKQTPLWQEVVNDPNYADIAGNEDEVASEVHSRLTGERGARILSDMIEDARKDGPLAVAERVTLVERLKEWLRDMFKALRATLGKWSKRDLEALTAEDFANLTLRDLAEGVDPSLQSGGPTPALPKGEGVTASYEGRATDDVVKGTNAVKLHAGNEDAGLERAREYIDAYESSPEAKEGRVESLSKDLHTPIWVIRDQSEIDALPSRRERRAKGWWSSKDDSVVVVLPNNVNVADVENTVVHEVVGHKGLRALIGEERFDDFLGEVYNHASNPIRKVIDKMTDDMVTAEADRLRVRKSVAHKRAGEDVNSHYYTDMAEARVEAEKKREQLRNEATEEYMSDLGGRIGSEGFEKMSRDELTLWGKIKAKVQQFLDKFLQGLKIAKSIRLNDKDLSYILYKSWKNLRDKSSLRSDRTEGGIFGEAEDVVMRHKTGWDDGMQVSEKRGRIEKLRKSEPVYISGEEIEYSSDKAKFKKNALEYGKKLQGSYVNEDTGKPIQLQRGRRNGGLKEVLQHDIDDEAHIKSIAAIPSIISKSIYIDTVDNHDTVKNPDVRGYEHYVCGLTIGSEDYTVHSIVANDKNGERYYDHKLSHIEKGKLLDFIEAKQSPEEILTPMSGTKPTIRSERKVKELIDILQIPDKKSVIRFRDPGMGLEESITKMKVEAMQANAGNLQAKRDAMRAIGGNLNTLRRAMARQREYDITTVKSVSDLARVLMDTGLLNDVSQYEIKRILGAINNVVGRQNVSKYVQKIMDILVDNQLREGANALGRLLSIRGSRVDARGIEVQGELDPDGQRIAQVVRKSTSLPKDDIDNRIEDAINRMSSTDNTIADEAAIEYAGLQIARQYVEDITESKAEEKALRDSIKKAKEDKDAGQMTEAAYKQYVEATNDAIRQNKIDRAEAFHSLVEQVGEVLGESIERAKAWREAEKERVREIQHNANSDMEGRPTDEHHKNGRVQKIANNSGVRFLLAPLATFDQMLRMFGKKNSRGEGYLWNRYMRGWVEASEKEYTGYQKALKVLDDKVAEVFSKSSLRSDRNVKSWGDLFAVDRKLPRASVSFMDGGEMKDHELTQGNLLYIYMADKMSDGRMKLRRMGITEGDVENIKNSLDPRFIELADWMQEEFLVDKRNEYNEVHKRMFGASMAAIENYFPLKILANARLENVDVADDTTDTALPATSTGSIIKRRRNNLALDVTGANAFSVILDHLQQMERWAAFAEFNRDLNTLLSYKRFRNQVMNMSSAYGAGKALWNNFRNVCSMAAGAYRPPIAPLDKSAINIAKGVTAAKVSFRIFTALKQFLSMPAYLSDSNPKYLAANIVNPIGAWNWAMQNLPLFEKRWKSRMAGDPRLLKTDMDWKMWRSRVVELATRVGMSPNAFVDALTVAIGAHSMYQTKLAKYKRQGYDPDVAEQRAKQDATILFNQTQQSSDGAFLSTMQVDRSWLSVLFTVFRNSSMSYSRQLYDAIRNISHLFTPGYKGLTEEFMAKQMKRDGIDPDQADRNAKQEYRRGIVRDLVRVGVFGYILQFAWNLGAYLPYLILGDDDGEKDKMMNDVFNHTMFGSIEGLTGGDVMSAAGNMWVSGEGDPAYLTKDMPLASDVLSILKNMDKDQVAAMNDVINLCVQSGLGVNPQSLTDAVTAVMDFCGDDAETSRECALLIARVLNCPQSQIDKIYFDELDASARDASKMTPSEIAERYARYKVGRGAPLTGWAYGNEQREKLMEKYRTRSNKRAKESIAKETDKAVSPKMADIFREYQQTKERVSEINKVKSRDEDRYYDLLDELGATPEYDRYEIVKDYKRDVDALTKEWLKAKTPAELDSCAQAIIALKREMVNKLQQVQ